MCMVSNSVPFCIDGVHSMAFVGTGVVISKAQGLVLTDRNTVPNSLGDITIQFASSLFIPAKLAYLHPVHNFAVLSYDPALLGDSEVAEIEVSPVRLRPGDDTLFIGLSKPNFFSPTYHSVFMAPRVTKIQALSIPALSPPRFRDMNCDVIYLDTECKADGAVLTDELGRVQAIWVSFSTQTADAKNAQFWNGVPIYLLSPMIESLKANMSYPYQSLDVELWPISLAEARALEVDPHWLTQFEKITKDPRQILCVRRTFAGSSTSRYLQDGDLLIAINHQIVSTFWQVEEAALQHPILHLDIFRAGKHLTLEVPTVRLSEFGTNLIVHWSGKFFFFFFY